MNKFFKTALSFLLILPILLMCFACGEDKLSTPNHVTVDSEQLRISWDPVPNARSYRLEISSSSAETQEVAVQRTSYDLATLTEGVYKLRVRALGGRNNDVYSDWSPSEDFTREKESGLLYSLVDGNTAYEVRSAGSASGHVEIKNVYRGKPVVGIGTAAFRGSTKVESVVIEEGISYISDNAFYNCANLTSVVIPETVSSIGRAAFQQCSKLTDINLPAAVTEIRPFTFAYCRSLAGIELGETILSIGESAFSNCSGMKEFSIPDSVRTLGAYAFRMMSALETVNFGSGITSIGSNAFTSCKQLSKLNFAPLDGELTLGVAAFSADDKLEEIVLPEGTVSIGSSCFANDIALAKITIPESVTTVWPSAFNGTALYNEQMQSGDGLVYADGWLVDATEEVKTTTTRIVRSAQSGSAGGSTSGGDSSEVITAFRENTVGIADAAFRYTRLEPVVIVDENGEPELDEEGNPKTKDVPMYVSLENVESIELPETLRYIGDYAFYRCPELWRIQGSYAYDLTVIGDYAFAESPKLRLVQFISGSEGHLTDIGIRAFFNCTVLPDSTDLVPDTVRRIGENAFYGTQLWRENHDNGVVYAGNWVVGYHIDPVTEDEPGPVATVDIRDGTVGICDYAFYADAYLQNITKLNGVRYIGKGAFAYCVNLSGARLNTNINTIEDYTFYKCQSIYSVEFPRMLRTIGTGAFYDCETLSGVDLQNCNHLTSIGEGAFRECATLQTLELGSSVEKIGRYAFFGCTTLQEVRLPDSLVSLGKRAFGDCFCLSTLTFGTNPAFDTIPDYAFAGCIWLRDVKIPANIRTIGNYAFYHCTNLLNLTLQEGVEKIGGYAFSGNERITYVALPESIKSIGIFAFKGCSSLESVLMKGEIGLIDENAFYACPILTIYATGAGENEQWSGIWNSSQRPVVWGVTLSEEGYLGSVTVGEITHPHPHLGFYGPGREGYVFVGWATEKDGEVQYSAAELENLPAGTVLYPVWEEAPPFDFDAWFDAFLDWLEEYLASQMKPDEGIW